MGNCTSKKSEKLLKSATAKKPIFRKMDKDQDNNNIKGLSKKVAPFTKGEVTSFGFRKKPNSSLPVPVTLTSSGSVKRETDDKKIQNGILKNKEKVDDSHSGSSVESLCHHAPLRLTPKLMRKKDLAKQTCNSTDGIGNNNNNTFQNNENIKTSFNPSNNNHNSRISFSATTVKVVIPTSNSNNSYGNCNIPPANRFGFRQQVPTRSSDPLKLEQNSNAPEKRYISNLGPYDTGTYRVAKKIESTRSKSEGPREAFFKQTLQPAGSAQSVLGQPKSNASNIPQPGKFTLQTSHLPRPQFPVRMPDTKTAKTVTNYYRRGGPQSDSNSSKEGSLNDDSGIESQSVTNSSRNNEGFESPGYNVRRRLQSAHGKKLEMKIVGNKFELLDKSEEKEPNVVTEVSLIKLPISGARASTAIINTGLVEQRTNQYLKRISQSNKRDYSTKAKDFVKPQRNTRVQDCSSDSSHVDEGFGAESEEEKLFKDRKGTEKSSVNFLMNDGYEDDEMLPGEAMAEDVTLSFSSDDETNAVDIKKKQTAATARVNLETEITPNTIRLDALKLSKQLKSGNAFMIGVSQTKKNVLKVEDSSLDVDDETLPSESILEQISSDSDSIGDKGENNHDGKEKNLKNIDDDVEIEELEEDVDVKKEIDLKNIDIEISDSELNIDEKELVDIGHNPAEPRTPDSPGTPTNASNSLSLSEGRDFLIDDEIADQPQLCIAETYPDCSCQEDLKTCNDKTVTSSENNNEFLSCAEGASILYKSEGTQAVDDAEDGELSSFEVDIIVNNISPRRRDKRLNSAGTLSPCHSLTSDDLIMDFECDDVSERINLVNGHIDGDDASCLKMVEDSFKDIRSHSSQKYNTGTGGGVALKSRAGSSTPGSPRSCDTLSNGAPSPLRALRSGPPDEDAIKIDKTSYENMFQDIAGIKKMLLKLKQVLTEAEGDEIENGMKCVADEIDCTDEMSDLRKQVTFLQQQLEEREKTVQSLQLEINKSHDGSKINGTLESRERCNAATQTERVRPISTGPSLLQNLPSDTNNLVSNQFSNSKLTRNQARSRMELTHDESNVKGFVSVKKSPNVEKIMEKVKELSFKPVEVLEMEEALREEEDEAEKAERKNNVKMASNILSNNNPVFKKINVNDADNCRKPSKNVFKITKIDLVLKSDNYGKNHLTQSNR